MLQWSVMKKTGQTGEKKPACLLIWQNNEKHSVLGAICSFKSAVSICIMDFEELQVDMDLALKKLQRESCGPSKLFVCIGNNDQRHQSREEMNHHWYISYMRIYKWNLLIHDQKIIPCFWGHRYDSTWSDQQTQLGKVMSAFSQTEDDLQPFCA